MICSQTGYSDDWCEPELDEDPYEDYDFDEGPELDWSGYKLICAPISSNGYPIRRPPAFQSPAARQEVEAAA
jgi:hypothetical protein